VGAGLRNQFFNDDAMTIPDLNLSNHFLIAMPSMLDPIFGGTVVYLCEHNERGALGMVINKPTDITMSDLFSRLDLQPEIAPFAEKPVMFGGPVQDDRGFVLHSPLGEFSSMLKVTDDIAFTTSRDVLEAVASGQGPQRLLVSIGYSGWGAGQLEEEIGRNGWLTVAADPAVIFDLPVNERYTAALKLLGVNPAMLSSGVGHA
jgi:putative transcriptional regulator